MPRRLLPALLFGTVLLIAIEAAAKPLEIASFNIQFLGHFKSRYNHALANILKDYDVVVVQELVAPPFDGTYPNGERYRRDLEAAAFFDEMKRLGFEYVLSPEDTGPATELHGGGTATEWWVTFFKPTVVVATDLPRGFLARDRSHNRNYERVPYAVGLRTRDGAMDFVLISVHLQPDPSGAARRKHELESIAKWIKGRRGKERDYVILGDMNIEDCDELVDAVPPPYRSLNSACLPTNTNVKRPRPYDHVLYSPTTTGREVGTEFKVINLIEAMRPFWTSTEPYPGEPYRHDTFRQTFSDHHPVAFKLTPLADGDDD
jgi:endonuclease/exonuclease/phosphatase family metal-dependent hydrolase